MAVWELSAAASQCRNIIEAYYLLCYLVFEPADDSEREFRQALWEFHEQFERQEMLQTGVPDSTHLASVAGKLKRCQARLEASPVFLALSKGHRQQLLEGRSFKLDSAIELSRTAGISEFYYRSQYKYSSTFAHSAPLALSQLDSFQAGTPKANQILGTLVDVVLGYSLMAIRDFISLFPDQTAKLNPELREAIKFWEDILRWEQSPHFRQPPETP